MPTARVVLHIGRQKTGTTSIQRFLAANGEVLAAEGILYPKAGREEGRHAAHHELAVALNPKESDGANLGELRRRYLTELESCPGAVVVFSSEAFQRIRDFGRLEHFFGPARPHVLCYLRECLAAKQSSWAQAVHATPQSASFVDFAIRTRHGYKPFVASWKRFADELEPALFERRRLHGGDVVADFLTRIGHAALAARLDGLARDDGLPSLGGNLLHLRHVMNVARAGVADRRGTFEALSALAAEERRWRGRWRVPAADRAAIERVDREDRRLLERLFGELAHVDHDALPQAPDPDTLADDTARILSVPVIADGFAALGLAASRR